MKRNILYNPGIRLFYNYFWYCLSAKRQFSLNSHVSALYDLISNALRGEDPVSYDKIDRLYEKLRSDHSVLHVRDLGMGSLLEVVVTRKVRLVVKKSSVNSKYGRLLTRLVYALHPSVIIELGTGAGFSTMYMGIASPDGRIFSVEGSPEIADMARQNVHSLGLRNIEISCGSFKDILPSLLQKISSPLFVFIDGDHDGDHLKYYLETILPYIDENTVIILDDIRWSSSMHKAWKYLIKLQDVSLSIDLFRMGILFFKKNTPKQHLILKF